MKRKKNWLLASLAAVGLIFNLSACGQKPAENTPPAKESTPVAEVSVPPEEKGPTSWRDYDLGKGTVVVYSTINENDMKMTEDVWYDAYPDVNIEWVSGGIGVVMARVESEKDNVAADIVYGGLAQTDGDIYHEYLQPYTSIYNDLARVQDPAGYYGYYSVQVETLVVNTAICESLGVEVKGYEDLLQPELKGKIIQSDPSSSSSAWRQLQTMLMCYGGFEDDKAWDYIDKLCANTEGFITNSSSAVYKQVVAGEYAVGISYETSCLQLLQDGAKDIEVIYPEEGNTMAGFAVAMVKDAPHQDAAAAFFDMIMSSEYQDISAENTLTRGVNKENSYQVPGMKPYEELGLIDIDFDHLIEITDDIRAKFNEINSKYMA